MARGGRPYKVPEKLKSLFLVIKDGDLKRVVEIIEKYGVDAYDPDKRTALINATFYGEIEIMRWLIEKGADVNYQDKGGYTPLHFAVQERRMNALDLLFENGANPNLKDRHGNSPLWTAVFNAKGNFDIVKKLIENGADLKSINNYDKSPEDFGKTVYGEDFYNKIKQ